MWDYSLLFSQLKAELQNEVATPADSSTSGANLQGELQRRLAMPDQDECWMQRMCRQDVRPGEPPGGFAPCDMSRMSRAQTTPFRPEVASPGDGCCKRPSGLGKPAKTIARAE